MGLPQNSPLSWLQAASNTKFDAARLGLGKFKSTPTHTESGYLLDTNLPVTQNACSRPIKLSPRSAPTTRQGEAYDSRVGPEVDYAATSLVDASPIVISSAIARSTAFAT